MTENTQTEGVGQPTPFNFKLVPTHTTEFYLDNVRNALSLDLIQAMPCGPHDGILSIAGGGPSLADTYEDLTGYVATINGSLAYLLSKGVKPHMCGVCDPTEKIADMIEAEEGVTYFIASCAHPKVFEKLLGTGCDVRLFHVREIDGIDEVLNKHYQGQYETIPGGCTMGLRWMTLGYYLGFRKFHLHGMDSSFRDKSSHAYPDHQDAKEWLTFDGYPTRINFIGQVVDFIDLMNESRRPGTDPVEIKMFGDGLLQHRYAQWLKDSPQ